MSRSTLAIAAACSLLALVAGCSAATTPAPPDFAIPPCKANSDCTSSLTGHVCSNGNCVVCGSNADCGAKKCDNGMECVECLAAGDCPAGQRCLAKSCAPGCDDKNPCPTGKVCDPVAGACVACAASKDCSGATPICDTGAHQCVGCVRDDDCGAGKVCHAQSCTAGCSGAHPQCPTGPPAMVCNVPAGACVNCIGDADCKGAGAPRCEVKSNTCVGCLSNDQCGAGQYCSSNACVAGCKANSDCGGGGAGADGGAGGIQCDLPSHTCVQCVDDTACGFGQVCAGNKCVAGCNPQHGCAGGQACCGGACVAILSDARNCGGCGNACATGAACCGGACLPTTTVANCGACGNACSPGADCCGGTCSSIRTTQNCGACGKTCGANTGCCDGQSCIALTTNQNCGACGTTCTGVKSCCGAGCVDLNADNKICGACGTACGAGTSCFNARCVPCINGTCVPVDYEVNLPFFTDTNDISGKGHNASIIGATANCCAQGGLSTDGSASFAQIPDGPGLDPNTITIGFWQFYRGGPAYPAGKYGGTCQCHPLQWDMHNDGCAFISRDGQENPCDSIPGFPTNAWSHYILRYDGTNSDVFMNGIKSGTRSLPGAMYSGGGAAGPSTSPITIGSAHATQNFNGLIRDFVIYDRALTDAEALSLARAPR